jgi:hypothetical protein
MENTDMIPKLKYGPYSPSRLDTAICGYAFYRQYVDPNKVKKKQGSVPQDRGSAVHEVFEQITKRFIADKNPHIDGREVSSWVSEAIQKYPVAYTETRDILQMAKMYINKPPPVITSDAQTELRLAVKWDGTKFSECDYDDPDAFGRGRADIFMISDDTTSALVYDHKTQPNIEPADTFQLGFYAWVIFNTYPFLKEIKTVLHFARYAYYSEEYVWTREQLKEIEDEICTRVHIIENRPTWDATPHKNCQYCDYMLECPALKECLEVSENGSVRVNMTNFKMLGDLNKAVKFAGLLTVLEETIKRVKGGLREYVETTGPVAIPGRVYEFRPEESVNWDKVNKTLKPSIYAIFNKHGIDPREFMGFSQTFSKSVWMMDKPDLVQELSAALPKKVSTEFKGHTV